MNRDKQVKGDQTEIAALRRLHQMTGRVVTASDMQQALDEILSASLEILEADFGDIQLLDQKSQALVIVAQHGFEQSFLDIFREVHADDETSCGRALRYGRRIVIEDVTTDAAYAPYLEAVTAAGYRAVQSTPLINHQGQIVGILSTQYSQPTILSERDEQLLDLLARHAADLLVNIQVERNLEERVEQRTTQVRQLVSELIAAEQTVRQRLAYTLHDDMQQLLYAAQVQIRLLRDRVGEQAELETLAQTIAESLRLTRRLTTELSPPSLQAKGLCEVLTWLANHMEEAYGLHVTVEANGGLPSITQEQQIMLFQIVRELLFNVVKHADVRAAKIGLQAECEGITLTVSDQGKGFDIATMIHKEGNNYGLHSVQERLRLLGGRANIDSSLGAGTQISLFLPYTIGG